ncbi:MAG: hypothetical protein AAF962_11295 [Actinomycetota bacterium]
MPLMTYVAYAARATTSTTTVVVCAYRRPVTQPEPPPEFDTAVLVHDGTESTLDFRRVGTDDDQIWVAKVAIDLASPRTALDVVVEGRPVASATASRLDPTADAATLLVGSCFDADGMANIVVDEEVDRLVADVAADRPIYGLWLGDQVYVDAPWDKTWGSSDAWKAVVSAYAKTLGLEDHREGSMRSALSVGSNWFLPDDHELWNNYPGFSPTLLRHAIGRAVPNGLRWLRDRVLRAMGRDVPEEDAHPARQGDWGRAGGEGYLAFQSDLTVDTFSRFTSPPGLQVERLGPVTLVLADTRWSRTVRRSGRFMSTDDLERLTALLRDPATGPVCLAVAAPLVGALPEPKPGLEVEFGPEHYVEQYLELWKALNDRARLEPPQPTVIVAGDIHAHSIKSILNDRVLEIVSSPLSLLRSLQGPRSGPPPVTSADLAYPRTGLNIAGGWITAFGRSLWSAPLDASGPVLLDVGAEGDGELTVTYDAVLQDPPADLDDEATRARYRGSFRFDGNRWVPEGEVTETALPGTFPLDQVPVPEGEFDNPIRRAITRIVRSDRVTAIGQAILRRFGVG